jgi:hypothetical protein
MLVGCYLLLLEYIRLRVQLLFNSAGRSFLLRDMHLPLILLPSRASLDKREIYQDMYMPASTPVSSASQDSKI